MHVQLANGPRWESRPAPDLTDPVGNFAFPVSGIVSKLSRSRGAGRIVYPLGCLQFLKWNLWVWCEILERTQDSDDGARVLENPRSWLK